MSDPIILATGCGNVSSGQAGGHLHPTVAHKSISGEPEHCVPVSPLQYCTAASTLAAGSLGHAATP
jgi:hypothetical protein